ncbi:EamA family transporter RarD [Collimonas fungivorans]|uniref:Chloramphenicol-sensitive protein n=1 Tax=Collimonas fungivorans (strain Ter331) TaxID=1005048 RepID=G0AC99_COLFT|nr:EamA family transporter RarD [Collimonas fungivorans]AEK62454.1 Chloramphenicol-sensitive protein [Collimonas fungivorans Ter331]
MNQHEIGRGISLSIGASMLFALMSGYTRLLAPLDGLDIFAWRVVWTLPAALALLVLRQRLPQARALLCRLAREPLTCVALLVVVALLGVQLWIFLWAPLHGRALEVSLGYFLLPLTMVLVGRFYYHERLDLFQWLAVACAVIGVLHELWLTRSFAWPTLVVALGYPPYFILRRKINADPVVAFALEMALLLPVAVVMLYARDSWSVVAHRPDMWLFLLPGLGMLSTVALGAYQGASRLLPMALFGILGYVEPVLLVGVAIVFLGESMAPGQLATYIPIWCAVLLTALHSVRLLRKERAAKYSRV